MKFFKKLTTPTARKRLISAALAVATLITALVVVPVTMSVGVSGLTTLTSAQLEASKQPGPYGPFYFNGNWSYTGFDGQPITMNVFYATQWAGHAHIKSASGSIFGLKTFGDRCCNQTKTDVNSTNREFYHELTGTFDLRVWKNKDTDNGLDPYIMFAPWDNTDRQVQPLKSNEYPYITITYAIRDERTNPDYSQLEMRLYSMTSAKVGADGRYQVAESRSLSQPIQEPQKKKNSDYEREFFTAIFDMRDMEDAKDWMGKNNEIKGFRFDYFQGGSDSKEGLMMFVDSIGFFKTKEEAEFHANERDWVRNRDLKGYSDDYNGRNIFRASLNNYGSYVPWTYGENNRNLQMEYIPDERAYRFRVKCNCAGSCGYHSSAESNISFAGGTAPVDGSDPQIMFILNGGGTASQNSGHNKAYGALTNKADRSLSLDYPFVAIVYKVPDTPQNQAELAKGSQMRLFYLQSGQDAYGFYPYAPDEVDGVQTTDFKGVACPYVISDTYQTAVFDFTETFEQINNGAFLEKTVRGFRLDIFDGSNGTHQETNHEKNAYILIDSIGFFRTEEEAKAFSRESFYFSGDDLELTELHNTTTEPYYNASNELDGVKITVAENCNDTPQAGTTSDIHQACGHMKYQQNANPSSPKLAVDPRAELQFKDNMRLSVKDYKYIVLEYSVPLEDINVLANVCPTYTCTCDNKASCINSLSQDKYNEENHSTPPLSIFPKLIKSGSGQVATEEYRVDQILFQTNNGIRIRYVFSFTDNQLSTYTHLTGVRVDLFNKHCATVGSNIILHSIGLYASKDEAYAGTESDYVDSYKITFNVDTFIDGETSTFPGVYPVKASSVIAYEYSDTKLTEGKFKKSQPISSENSYLREHYQFVGFEAYYKDSNGNLQRLDDRIYKPGEEVTAELSDSRYSSKVVKTSNKVHMVLEVILKPVWQWAGQVLTITPPADVTGDTVCMYRITGTATDVKGKNPFENYFTLFPDKAICVVTEGQESVKVWLPDGNYTVELLTDWGWRYYGNTDLVSESIPISQFATEIELSVERNNEKTEQNETVELYRPYMHTDTSGQKFTVPGIWEVVGEGTLFQVDPANPPTWTPSDWTAPTATYPQYSFADRTVQNGYWLNGYGSATTYPAPVVEETTEPAA